MFSTVWNALSSGVASTRPEAGGLGGLCIYIVPWLEMPPWDPTPHLPPTVFLPSWRWWEDWDGPYSIPGTASRAKVTGTLERSVCAHAW